MDKNEKNIVYIEDERMITELVDAAFKKRKLPYKLFFAETGEEGIKLVGKILPDIVLLDMGLPDIKGLTVLEKLKSYHETKHIPVIIISGSSEKRDMVAALRNGAVDFINKPFDIEELVVRVGVHIKQLEYMQKIEAKKKMLEEDLRAGQKIQFRLLPEKKKEIYGYKFERYLFPSLSLSGDFVDYFKINEDCIGFYIADVSGHGLSSAFVTVFIKAFFQNELTEFHENKSTTIFSPPEMLDKLNKDLLSENLGKHATIFYGVINKNENKLYFTNAGQFPYPVLKTDSELKYISKKGTPVGLFDFVKYESYEIDLPDKFLIFMLSDGILEIIAGEKFEEKEKKFFENIERVKNFDDIIDFFKIKEQEELPDDITILSIERS